MGILSVIYSLIFSYGSKNRIVHRPLPTISSWTYRRLESGEEERYQGIHHRYRIVKQRAYRRESVHLRREEDDGHQDIESIGDKVHHLCAPRFRQRRRSEELYHQERTEFRHRHQRKPTNQLNIQENQIRSHTIENNQRYQIHGYQAYVVYQRYGRIETTRTWTDTPLLTAYQCSKKISKLLSCRTYLTIIGGRWHRIYQRQEDRHHPKKKRTSLICIAGRIRRLWRNY